MTREEVLLNTGRHVVDTATGERGELCGLWGQYAQVIQSAGALRLVEIEGLELDVE